MNRLKSLQQIHDENVPVDKKVQSFYNEVITFVIKDVTRGIREHDAFLDDIFVRHYLTGSKWDKLQVGSKRQEVDINLCFNIPGDIRLEYGDDFGADPRPNFFEMIVRDEPDEDLKELCEEYGDGRWIVKPSELFKRMFDAGEQYLKSINNLMEIEECGSFKVTTEVGNPWTLKLSPIEKSDVVSEDITFDFVPTVVVDDYMLPPHILNLGKVRQYLDDDLVSDDLVLAIALNKIDSYRFEIDCHELEKKLLRSRGQAKKVVKMMKLIRNKRKGPLEKLSSHMIKTVVMRKIIQLEKEDIEEEEKKEYWDNLEVAFKDCMEFLSNCVARERIMDVLFPKFNQLKSIIKDKVYRRNMKKALKHVVRLLEEGDYDLAFQAGACSLCDEFFTTSTGECDEKKLKNHLSSVHNIRTWCKGGASCTCIKDKDGEMRCLLELGKCDPEELEREYRCRARDCKSTFKCHDRLVQHSRDAHNLVANLKHAICLHCNKTLRTKCGLYQHIYMKHPDHRTAAEEALKQKDSECVNSIEALEDALSSSSEGDRVVICDGDYEDWNILMDTKGLTLSAATPGKVSLHLGSQVTVAGMDNKLSGLKFHGGGSKTPINISGDRNTVSDCVVEHHQAPHWVNILGRENTVRNCRFSNKTAKPGGGQQLLQSRVSSTSHHNNIISNVFSNFHYENPQDGDGGNGYETVQIRDGDNEQGDGFNTVEGNYFYSLNAETEVVSIKSRFNTISGNAFEANEGSLTLRNGDYNTVVGNVWQGWGLKRSAGMRIFGRHHIVSQNWFVGLKAGALSVGAGDDIHVAAENITMENNKIENCYEALRLGAIYDQPPQEPIVFITNVVSNDDDLKMIEQNPPECDYDFSSGNYFFGSNLGWSGPLPAGLVWDRHTMDLGEGGKELLREVRCQAGPEWEQDC